MATLVKYPTTSNNVWTNSANAYASDGVYATASPSKNGQLINQYGGFGFNSIPAGSTINSVTIEVKWKISITTQGIATLSVQNYVGGVAKGTIYSNTTLSTTDVINTTTTTGITSVSDLTDANYSVWVTAKRSSANTAFTASLDYVKVTVDYTPLPTPAIVNQSYTILNPSQVRIDATFNQTLSSVTLNYGEGSPTSNTSFSNVSSITYTITVKDGVAYYYNFSMTNVSETVIDNNSGANYTFTTPATPLAVTHTLTNGTSTATISLTFNKMAKVTSYKTAYANGSFTNQTVNMSNYAMGYSINLSDLRSNALYKFYVTLIDVNGVTTTYDNGGLYHTFNTDYDSLSATISITIPQKTFNSLKVTVSTDKFLKSGLAVYYKEQSETSYNNVVTYPNDLSGGGSTTFLISGLKSNIPYMIYATAYTSESNVQSTSLPMTVTTLLPLAFYSPDSAITKYDFEDGLAVGTVPSGYIYGFDVVPDPTGSGKGNVLGSTNKGVQNSKSGIQFTFNYASPYIIGCDYYVSSEKSWDFIKFWIDNTEVFEYSGYVTGNGEFKVNTIGLIGECAKWSNFSYNATAGTHVLKIEYTKDNSVDGGLDTAYVDNVGIGLDTIPPIINSVSISNVTETSAIVNVATAEYANIEVNYGTSVSSVDNVVNPPQYYTTHSVMITPLNSGTRYYVQVKAKDSSSNTTVDNNSGSYYIVDTLRPASSTPTITITNVTLNRISAIKTKNRCTVTFTSDQDLTQWEARADGTGYGSGDLVGSGGALTAGVEGTFDVDDIELLWGDKSYKINVYGQNSAGQWTIYENS